MEEVRYYTTVFLDEALKFLSGVHPIIKKGIVRKISKAECMKDSIVFKKLKHDIWEFRFRFGFTQIRLLAFWGKSNSEATLVVATHGFIKKTDKVPGNEIERAINIRNKYFEQKTDFYGQDSNENIHA